MFCLIQAPGLADVESSSRPAARRIITACDSTQKLACCRPRRTNRHHGCVTHDALERACSAPVGAKIGLNGERLRAPSDDQEQPWLLAVGYAVWRGGGEA